MFQRVLIAEDHESANISLRKTLESLGIHAPDHVYHCDVALSRIQKAINNGDPYDLLVTDLSFEEDENKQQLQDGPALITAARQIQPALKVLVFSLENRPAIIDGLFEKQDINGYVRKARRDVEELKAAIENIFNGRLHIPADMKQSIKQKNACQFSDRDIAILSQLSKGTLQKNIPAYLEANNILPSSLSSIEKRLNIMKQELQCSTNEQLVAVCQKMGII